MSIALAAFIIALCSLIWNITSTLRSWQLNKPHIKLNVTTVHVIDEYPSLPSLRVNVMNTGSSPVAIASIFIWAKRKKGGKSGRGIDSVSGSESEISHVLGSPLPFTIAGYHSQSWVFDSEWTQLSIHEAYRGQTAEILIEVRMATGKSVQKEINIDDYLNPGEIEYLISNMLDKIQQTPVLGVMSTANTEASNQLSNDRSRRPRTPADKRGRHTAAQSKNTKA